MQSTHEPSETNDSLGAFLRKAREDKNKQDLENARMMQLYRENVLNEKPIEVKNGFVSLDMLKSNAAPAVKVQQAEEVLGD